MISNNPRFELSLERGAVHNYTGDIDDLGNLLINGAPLGEYYQSTLSWLPYEGSKLTFFSSSATENISTVYPVQETLKGFFRDKEGFYVRFILDVLDVNYIRIYDTEIGHHGILKSDNEHEGFMRKDAFMDAIQNVTNNHTGNMQALPWERLHPTILTLMLNGMHERLHDRAKVDARYPEFLRSPTKLPVI